MKSWSLLLLSYVYLSLASGVVLKGNVASKYLFEGNTDVSEYMEGVDFKSSTAPKVIVFYSPFCGHCINYAPKYMQIAKDVTAKYPKVEFYAVSCKAHRDVCAEHTIRGYPTLHAFPAGSETSAILRSTSKEEAIVDALKLDEMQVELERKLDVEEGDTDEDNGGGVANVEEEEDESQEKENSGDAGAEEEEDSTNGKSRPEGRLSNAAKDSDADDSEAKSEADAGSEDATATDEDNKDNDSKGDADAVEVVDSNENTDESEDKDNEESGGAVEEADPVMDMLNLNRVPPPAADVNEDGETEETKDDTADENNAGQDSAADDEEDEETDGADDATDGEDQGESDESEPRGGKESWEEDSDKDLDRINDAPRGGKDISEAVRAYRESKNGTRPGAGAQKAKVQARDMDKWKELIAKKKEEFNGRRFGRGKRAKNAKKGIGQQTNAEGVTNVMKANTPGTPEYKEHIQKLLNKINKLRKKRGLPPMTSPIIGTKKSEMPLKKEVRDPGFVRKQGEKLPIVKRVFKMTEEEELILDASLSFMAGLRYGVFMSNDTLTAKQKAALKGWLDLLSVSLPPEWGLHSLIDELSENIDMVSQSNENLLSILRKHPLPRRAWSPSCTRRDSPQGFSCGTWKLLHTSTVGIAEQRGGLNLVQSGAVDAATRVFSPADAADTIREYMAHFFGCIECRNHFLAQYDQCSFRRCDRLTDDATLATAEDWKQLALWLWEVHNDVSVRVAHERIDREMQNVKTSRFRMARLKREDEIKHLYPSLEQCFACFDENGAFNEDNVFEFLEATYWSAPDVTADKLLQYRGEEGSGSGFFWFSIILVLAVIYVVRGRKVNGIQRTVNAAVITGRRMGGKKRSA